ncbi:hypothetical protein EV702DRAFT_1044809 [Suillus placidus]|uniref:Uncharacterized protein n=1 Tax=Suillus placidus TaxID=48579 RepID=A0A9P6ZWQ3_9AGAM|nr:hypothetical protein EV702DRAFT_1044809 [Suillus placidus]
MSASSTHKISPRVPIKRAQMISSRPRRPTPNLPMCNSCILGGIKCIGLTGNACFSCIEAGGCCSLIYYSNSESDSEPDFFHTATTIAGSDKRKQDPYSDSDVEIVEAPQRQKIKLEDYWPNLTNGAVVPWYPSAASIFKQSFLHVFTSNPASYLRSSGQQYRRYHFLGFTTCPYTLFFVAGLVEYILRYVLCVYAISRLSKSDASRAISYSTGALYLTPLPPEGKANNGSGRRRAESRFLQNTGGVGGSGVTRDYAPLVDGSDESDGAKE